MTAPMPISLEVNGERVEAQVLPRLNLADFLREHLQLTGTHVGCEHGVCGACTVRVNGEIVRSCLMLAVQTNGASIETIEGLSDSGEIADLQAAFRDRNALQCGFCTPGMLMAAQDCCSSEHAEPDRERSASISPAITAAAPAIRPSSMRSRRPRGRARMGRKP
jgi:carbon-monoxide dehydrogenase small subunit